MAPKRDSAGRLLVLIPAYNEEANLAAVIAGVREAAPNAEVLVIDDCSRDRTADEARRSGARLVRHPINLGYGASLMTGYRYAVRHDVSCVVQLDGDGQHDPAGIPALCDAIEAGCDLALGSRFDKSTPRYKAPLPRAIGMWLFGRIATLALGQKISDPTSGFQALSAGLIRFHVQGNHFPRDYPDADILILVGRAGFKLREVPVTMFEKPGGATIHSGLRPLYYVIKMMLSILLAVSGGQRAPGREV